MFTVSQLADTFCQSEQKIGAALYVAGFSPCDYGIDGHTAHYDRAAAEHLADLFPLEEIAPPATIMRTAPTQATCKMVPGKEGMRCEL